MYFTDLNPIFATGIVVECFYRDELEEDEDFTDLTSLGNEKLNNIIPFKSIIINETSPRIIRGDSKYSISKNRDTSSINRTSKTFKHNSKKSKKSTSRNPKK